MYIKILKFIGAFILGLVFVFAIILIDFVVENHLASRQVKPIDKVITHNPVDLQYISQISNFRSCAGHDFSGYNVDAIREKNRSMKHYLTPRQEYYDAKGKVPVYAPFDGKLTHFFNEGRGGQVWISVPNSKWNFVFFHIVLIDEVKVGDNLKAGDLIGHANTIGADNFDMAFQYGHDSGLLGIFTGKILKFGYPPFYNQYDSVFNYMQEDVLTEYEAYGFTKDDFILSKEYRDENPCNFKDTKPVTNDWNIIYQEFEPLSTTILL